MLRIAAILSLLFYISVSIGVHVDVDTCCKSIAGLSLFSDSGAHIQAIEDDCCAQTGPPTCHPIQENGPVGCPSDCVYIQVLMDTPPPAVSSVKMLPTPVDVELLALACTLASTLDYPQPSKAFDDPPSIAMQEDLYLIQGAHITYG